MSGESREGSKQLAALWPLLAASSLALALYLPALGHGPVTDDRSLVLENPHFGSFRGLVDLFTMDVWASSRHGEGTEYYRPFAMGTLWLTHALGGGAPWAHRLGNLLAHVAGAWLLWRALAQRLGVDAQRWACPIAALWLLHPLHSEVVLWLVGRFDVLAGLCLLGAWAAQGSVLGPRWRIGGSLTLAAMALFSKEAALPALALLVVDAVWLLGWPRRRAALLTAGLCGLAVAYLALRQHAGLRTVEVYAELGLGSLFGAAVRIALTYLELAVVPTTLDAFHEYHPLATASAMAGAAALGLGVGALVLAWRRGCAPGLGLGLWGIAFALVTLLPAVAAGPGLGTFGDRYAYVPSVGVAAFVVALLAARSGRTGGRSRFARLPAAEALLVVLALAYAGRTALRIPDWQSEQALATAMIRDDPGHSYARYVLGYAFATGGRVTEAEPLLLESAELNPMQWRTWNALCFVHLRMNRLDQAAEECEHSLRLHTRNSRTWLNLASVRLLQQRWPDAVAAAARALALRPCYASALHVQAVAFEKVGELEQAVATLKLGRRCDPSHVGLGELEAQLIDRGVLRQSPDGPR